MIYDAICEILGIMGYAIYGVQSSLVKSELGVLALCSIAVSYGFVIIGKSYVRLVLGCRCESESESEGKKKNKWKDSYSFYYEVSLLNLYDQL